MIKCLFVKSGLCVALGVLTLSTGACGNDGDDKKPPPKAAVAGKSPAELLAAMREVFKKAKSVHVEGAIEDQDGRMVINMSLGADTARGDLTAPVQKKPVAMEVIRTGDRAFLRSEDIWRLTLGKRAVARLGNRWVLVPKDKLDVRIRSLSLTEMAQIFTIEGGTLTHGGAGTVHGRSAVLLKHDTDGTLYVSAEGSPVPLKIVDPGGKNSLTFSRYDEPIDTSDPADFIDLAKISKG